MSKTGDHQTPTQIAELRRLLSEATDRPWRADDDWADGRATVAGLHRMHVVDDCDPADAALIAAAVNALGPLLDRLEELERLLADASAHIATLEREMVDD